ncbi:MAG: TIGR03790 family protein [Gammaproteobacteria bacterium]|nr:TIGR03790 family protein [Gammaproteobacteria bacterium]MBI5616435.1 TIGR03790 family protein [Gammaproteobacteria bacterium]
MARVRSLSIPLAFVASLVCGRAAALDERQLAVIINDADPQSVEVGGYYAEHRHIPAANVIHVRFSAAADTLDPAEFDPLIIKVKIATPPGVQAYALTWTRPYRVGCMSITTAFAMGYGQRFCAAGCRPTAPNPYFNSPSRRPWDDTNVRPAMMLGAVTAANAERLIDRGVAADFTAPPDGAAYLLVTSDAARSTRAPGFPEVRQEFGGRLPVNLLRADGIRDRYDVMFYFTGTVQVPYLDTLGFLPGAIGDHLTSAGGVLFGDKQMSALRWLEAGATGSYGTVAEPCNFTQKFPNPAFVMKYYLAGETLIEAYWKSVVWPGQGLFIGEPLARPYAARNAD